MKKKVLTVILGAALVSAVCANAATAAQQCAKHQFVVERLQTKYGESRQSIGLAANNGVVEVFASEETRTWTILVTQPNGVACLIASGQAFEALEELAQAAGDDA